jgi:hypothetical protein
MRFLESNEIWEWCAERHIALQEDVRPADDPNFVRSGKWLYAGGERSGREPQVAVDCVRALGPWTECLVWITLTGVWASSEDWPAVYAWRGAHGERRSVDVAPGYLFETGEESKLTEVLTRIMENGWDACVLPATGRTARPIRARISHDEWIELRARSRSHWIHSPAGELRRYTAPSISVCQISPIENPSPPTSFLRSHDASGLATIPTLTRARRSSGRSTSARGTASGSSAAFAY